MTGSVIKYCMLFPNMEIGLGEFRYHKINLKSKATIGYIVMILSAAFTGLTNTFAKPLIDIEGFQTMEISPIALVAIIYLINAFFFTPFAKNSTPLKTIGRRNMFFLSLIGVSEVAGLMTYFFGLRESTAINSAIMSEGEMIFSLLIAITILRERLQRKEFSPFAMIIVGMVIIPVGIDMQQNGFMFSDLVFGDMLILLSGLFYALDINLCKYVSKRLDAKRITQLTSFVSGGFALALMLMFNVPFNIDWSQVPSIIVLSIIGTGLAAFLFIIALRLIGAVRSLLLYSSSSAFGVIFSSIFLGESITVANIVSIVLVMSGVYFLRNRLAEDDSSKEKLLPPTQRFVKRKWFKLSEINNSNMDSVESQRVIYPQISQTLSKLEWRLRFWFMSEKNIFQASKYNEMFLVYRCYLGKGIMRIISHNKRSPSTKLNLENLESIKSNFANQEGL
jgi:drug/metabolite transporter (DMT)-like permease